MNLNNPNWTGLGVRAFVCLSAWPNWPLLPNAWRLHGACISATHSQIELYKLARSIPLIKQSPGYSRGALQAPLAEDARYERHSLLVVLYRALPPVEARCRSDRTGLRAKVEFIQQADGRPRLQLSRRHWA